MGITNAILKVKERRKSEKTADVNFLVDSGAFYSLVPGKFLDELDIEPYKERSFSLADGTVLKRKVYSAYFESRSLSGEGEGAPSPVVYGEEGDEPLLGATTLGSLGLVLNPFTRPLHPMKMLMAKLNKLKFLLIILFSLMFVCSYAQQTDEEKLVITVKEFHLALVNKNTVSINQQTDKVLSYGHSNGWVETKADVIKDLETGYISYQAIKEDSILVAINGNMANVRFLADISATSKGVTSNFKLRVLEVWVKKSNRWVLFARQGVKVQ